MSNILKYVIGTLIVFLLLLAWQFQLVNKRYKQEKADRIRLEENVKQLLAEKQQDIALILTQKEITGKVLKERDSLANALKIRPKQIIKYVDRIIREKTTDTIEVEVNSLTDITWKLSDGDKCWKWEADAELIDFDLNINRTLFEYSNKTSEVYWFERKRILFFRIGKKQYFQKSMPQCGTVSTRSIEIKKK